MLIYRRASASKYPNEGYLEVGTCLLSVKIQIKIELLFNLGYISFITTLQKFETMDIQLYGVFHKPFPKVECEWMHPIAVGGNQDIIDSCRFRDSEGVNVAYLNPYYCELTAHYWVRHNQPSKYVGFFHYRRYFSFLNIPGISVASIPLHEQFFSFLTSAAQYAQLTKLLNVYDVVMPHAPHENSFTIEERYLNLHEHLPWKIFKDTLVLQFPKYLHHVEYFSVSCSASYWNMFVMPWNFFCNYIDELFSVLEMTCRKVQFDFSPYQNRYPGFLAERFLGFYLHANKLTYCRCPMLMLMESCGGS